MSGSLSLWVPLIGSIVGASALGYADYVSWGYRHGMLAEDDFFARCTSAVSRGELQPGRYESVVWSEVNDLGICEDVIGTCNVNLDSEGRPFGDSLPEHEVRTMSDDSSNCTYFGGLFAPQSPWKRVN